ncbi:hypothetical protein, partial [Bacteroides uniformis]|uniref:hypothetical protein n=1 Tax=Bacteroides uniformis TaxID=820 RepID=UPI00195D96EB
TNNFSHDRYFFICYYSVSTSASVADANKKTNVVPNCSEQPQIYTCGSLSVSLAELKSFFLSEITIC